MTQNLEQDGAQGLLDFVEDFADDHGRYPKQAEIPVKKQVIIYHFGSYEALIRIARIGEIPLPMRKGRKKRYCRNCGKPLPRNRWFFCPPPKEHMNCIEKTKRLTKSCEQQYADRKNRGEIPTDADCKKILKKERRKMWRKCTACPHKCKIYLPKGGEEPVAKIVCKADPEYEEINDKLIKGL